MGRGLLFVLMKPLPDCMPKARSESRGARRGGLAWQTTCAEGAGNGGECKVDSSGASGDGRGRFLAFEA